MRFFWKNSASLATTPGTYSGLSYRSTWVAPSTQCSSLGSPARSIPSWLKWAVLANPLVYMSEGLRASLTPTLPHMPIWGFSTALVLGGFGLTLLSLRTFHRRVVD